MRRRSTRQAPFEPMGKLVRSLAPPRNQRGRFTTPQPSCSGRARRPTGPDLHNLVGERGGWRGVLIRARARCRLLDGTVPVYLCWLAMTRTADWRGSRGVPSERRFLTPRLGPFLAYPLLRPGVECLRRELPVRAAALDSAPGVAAQFARRELELLLGDGARISLLAVVQTSEGDSPAGRSSTWVLRRSL